MVAGELMVLSTCENILDLPTSTYFIIMLI